jgi:hypothetical protein
MMKTLILQRLAHYSHPHSKGITGVMIDPNGYIPFAVTLELPWMSNKPFISCIPSSIYTCERVMSPKYGTTFEVKDVFNRSNILIHWGNLDDNTQGCILLGESFGVLKGEPAIMDSMKAFKEFMQILKGEEEFRLDLRKPCVNPMYP